jgi:tRNA(Ile)-lysidine synthase
MPDLPARVGRFAARHQLWRDGAPVVAAVSGGADSVALLHVLLALERQGGCRLAAVAHLNHHVRATECDRDEAFVRALAARLGVPLDVGAVDVPSLGAARGWSIEVAGRHARHAFLEEVRRQRGAEVVAAAHTADDQAETVLLRLVRGAGPAGLRGMLPRRGLVVRPLLNERRATLRRWLGRLGETWQEDSTNADLRNPRNRVRHALLPLLAQQYAPAIVEVLGRTADIAREDEAFLAALTTQAAAGVLMDSAEGLRIDATALAALPAALQRRVARRALETVGQPRAYGLREALAVVEACQGGQASIDLPGVRMERIGPGAVLLIRGATTRPVQPAWPLRTLVVPGTVALPDAGGRIVATGPLPVEEAPPPTPVRAVFDGALAGARLAVRNRRPGDRLRPRGLGGRSKKLQDVLVDRKVPRTERDAVPLVVDAEGRILWVARHVPAEEFRVTAASTSVVVLEWECP